MSRATVAGGVLAAALLLAASVFLLRDRPANRTAAPAPAAGAASAAPASEVVDSRGFLFGRVRTLAGGTYEGRLRWGGDQEAFWGDFFNGRRKENPWAALVPPEERPRESRPISVFGLVIAEREREVDLTRLFMARFGDVSRIEARGKDVRVTLKSGTAFDLARLEASDFDDGVRVWPAGGDFVDLDSSLVRSIELLPAPRSGGVPSRLHGTVRTRSGSFSGFVQWDREKCVGTDELAGRSGDGETRLRFDAVRSVARLEGGGVRVTLGDGREATLSGSREVGEGNRGTYVDDPRYGRVLVSWGAFERLDLTPGGSGPAYGDFPPGRPLSGAVTTRAGARLAGRIVYDLDESETTETLDAPAAGVDYTIPLGLVASIVPAGDGDAALARVTLRSGEELRLERKGDLGDGNAGLLVFAEGGERPDYVPWSDVARIDLASPESAQPRPPASDSGSARIAR